MKRGYRKLLIFDIIITAILILNGFVSSILSDYTMLMFLIIILVIFRILFGFEKDRHRYTKDIIMEELIFLLMFFIIYYLSGLFFGFAKVDNYYTIYGLFVILLPHVLIIVIKEFLRYMMLQKSEGNKLLIVCSCILFILIDVSVAIYYGDFSTGYNSFLFLALTLFPAICTNIVCSYITIKTGYKPVIFYLLIMYLYQYLIPIIPNPNEYFVSLVRLIVPAILAYRIYAFHSKEHDNFLERDYRKRKAGSLLVPVIIVVFLVYITSGYFHFYAVAIASGSMVPTVYKGDVVVIEKIDDNFDELEPGQILAYKYDNVIIVHRIVKILNDAGQYYIYTKGDANEDIDSYAITEDMVIGKVNMKVPYIGLPTVWLNNL